MEGYEEVAVGGRDASESVWLWGAGFVLGAVFFFEWKLLGGGRGGIGLREWLEGDADDGV